MLNQDATLIVFVKETKEQRADRWAIYCNELNFFAYGATEAEAKKDVQEGVQALVDSFKGDIPKLKAWLDSKGVVYQIVAASETETTYSRSLEVALAAA